MSTSPSISTSAQPSVGVSDTRFARLARGINLSHWFAQARSYDQAHLTSYMTRDDIALIAGLGFAHVRLTLNPVPLLDPADPDRLNGAYLATLDAALDMILAHDLAVIVDPHPDDDFKHELAASEAAVTRFVQFWRALAGHMSARDPERVFLEVLNEPMFKDGAQWAAVQTQLLAAMRAGAPQHTLIATGHEWSGIPELLALEPSADPNVVYNFHCYEPHDFTHQGATWGADHWPYLPALPYPSSPEALAQILPTIEHDVAQRAAHRYAEERWDAARVDAWIAQAAEWGARHNVRLTCNEFGVYRLQALPAQRNAWIRDVRAALERYSIGWTMWDYAGGFSVVTTQQDRRAVDAETAQALGLS